MRVHPVCFRMVTQPGIEHNTFFATPAADVQNQCVSPVSIICVRIYRALCAGVCVHTPTVTKQGSNSSPVGVLVTKMLNLVALSFLVKAEGNGENGACLM